MDYELIYELNNFENEAKIVGPNNIFLNYMETFFNTEILIKQGSIYVLEDFENAKDVAIFIEALENLFNQGLELNEADFLSLLNNMDGL